MSEGVQPVSDLSAPSWSGDPGDLVDLARYPVHSRQASAYQAMVAEARAALGAGGAVELSGFVAAAGMGVLLDDAVRLAPLAWRDGGVGTAYLAAPDGSFPPGHPRRFVAPRSLGAVAYDLFPEDSPLRALYEWDLLMRFLDDVLQRGQLYRYADSCGALNLSVMIEGDELQWHFDQTDFVVSLSLRDAEVGGDFEVVPAIRSVGDERYDEVARVLAGERDRVVTMEMTPGTLFLFEGRHSLHRVSRVAGGKARLVALLSYDTKPGTVSSERLRRVRYGREPEGDRAGKARS